jgi:hypothetical protein
MKKFLSIFVAVAMVFSLFAGTFAPRASALTTTLSDTGKVVTLEYFSALPQAATNTAVLSTSLAQYVYLMGDVIHGTAVFTDIAAGTPYTVQLVAWDGAAYTVVLDSVTAYQVAGVTSYPFQIGTGNVTFDGPYQVRVIEGAGSATTEALQNITVFIKYNLTWKIKTIANCSGSVTLEGWITRGNFMAPSQPVIVAITYPDKLDTVGYIRDEQLAAAYFVTNTGSGQFSLTFQVKVVGDVTLDDMGDFEVYLPSGCVVSQPVGPDVRQLSCLPYRHQRGSCARQRRDGLRHVDQRADRVVDDCRHLWQPHSALCQPGRSAHRGFLDGQPGQPCLGASCRCLDS